MTEISFIFRKTIRTANKLQNQLKIQLYQSSHLTAPKPATFVVTPMETFVLFLEVHTLWRVSATVDMGLHYVKAAPEAAPGSTLPRLPGQRQDNTFLHWPPSWLGFGSLGKLKARNTKNYFLTKEAQHGKIRPQISSLAGTETRIKVYCTLLTEQWNNITAFFQFPQILLGEYSWQVVSIQDMLTLSMECFIFHQEILACFTSLSWLYEPVSIYLHLFKLVTPELNTLFYFDDQGDRCNENNL